jgi:hypothetical protein
MKITNRLGLPQTLVNAVKSHNHKGADYSASMLCNPPRIVWLNKRHKDEMEEDVADRIWSLFGTAMHYIIEKGVAESEIAEQYFETEIEGKRLSGTCDLYNKDNGTITDWKTDSVWTLIYKSREHEREVQLNAYAYLFRMNGIDPKKLQIISLLRDWNKKSALNGGDYPRKNIVITEYNLWDIDKQREYFTDCIKKFEWYRDVPDDDLPQCTMDDMWQQPTKYAVMRKGYKSAKRVYDNLQDAEDLVEMIDGGYIVKRESKRNRCEDYCPANKFCNQYQDYLKAKEAENDS